MYGTLRTIHTGLGYLVFLAVLVGAIMAWNDGRKARKPALSRASGLMILIDVHVTVGIVLYVVGRGWEFAPLVAWLHPALALAALGVGHAGLARARRAKDAASADAGIARALIAVLVLVTAAIGVASAA